MATTHDRIKALSHRVYVDAIPLGEFCEALAEFAEAERAEADVICAAWDVFDAALVEPPRTDDGAFRMVDSPAAWAAYHHIDKLVSDWQAGRD